MSEPAAPAAAPPAGPARAPRRRGLWIALIASLAVNVFVLGWIGSSWVYGTPPGPSARASAGAGMFLHRRAARALGGEERAAAERIWRENYGELRERVRAMRQAHAGLRAAFTAEQADAKSLGDAVAEYKAKASAVFDQVNATLLKVAATLPPEARKSYFNAGFPRGRGFDRERRRGESGDR